MASFWHDSIFFQFISLRGWIGRVWSKKEGRAKEETAKGTSQRKDNFLIRNGEGVLEILGKTEISQGMFAFHLVTLMREVIAPTGCTVCMCVRRRFWSHREVRKQEEWGTDLFRALPVPVCCTCREAFSFLSPLSHIPVWSLHLLWPMVSCQLRPPSHYGCVIKAGQPWDGKTLTIEWWFIASKFRDVETEKGISKLIQKTYLWGKWRPGRHALLRCHIAGDAETRSLVFGFSTQHYYEIPAEPWWLTHPGGAIYRNYKVISVSWSWQFGAIPYSLLPGRGAREGEDLSHWYFMGA